MSEIENMRRWLTDITSTKTNNEHSLCQAQMEICHLKSKLKSLS
jgi:hypothetical protein